MEKKMEVKRCSGYGGHWECAEEYPNHMVSIKNFSKGTDHGLHRICKKCDSYYASFSNARHERHPVTGQRKHNWKNVYSKSLGGIQNTPEWQSYLDKAEEQWGKEVTYWKINDKVVDITPRFKSEFGPSKPMTKRESKVVEGEKVPEGWVYIVQNPDVPWVLKIGKTWPDGIREIMSSARRFGRSELVYKFQFAEALKAEQAVHAILHYCNLRTLGYDDCGMELFKCTLEEAIDAINKVYSENDRPSLAVG
jgi:hypothetical protein